MYYLVHNEWTGKYYLVNDRKSGVVLGNKMIEDWKKELCGEDFNPKDYDFETEGDFRGKHNYKSVGLNDWKSEITITLTPYSEFEIVEQGEKEWLRSNDWDKSSWEKVREEYLNERFGGC